MGVAGQKPTAVGLLAVDGHTMAGKVRRRAARAWGDGQRVLAPRIGDFSNDHDFFQIADATYVEFLVSRRKMWGKSIAAKRQLARTDEHDIIRQQREQAGEIAGVNGVDPG